MNAEESEKWAAWVSALLSHGEVCSSALRIADILLSEYRKRRDKTS